MSRFPLIVAPFVLEYHTLPVPCLVIFTAAFVAKTFAKTMLFVELFTHVCDAVKVTGTFWLFVALPIVAVPAPDAIVIPPAPTLRARFVPSAERFVAAVFVKVKDLAA